MVPLKHLLRKTTLSSDELFDICMHMRIFNTFIGSRDEIDDETFLSHEHFIVNIQARNQGNGTHWVAGMRIGSSFYYSDSFGAQMVQELYNEAKRYCSGGIFYSKKDIQSFRSDCCGWYCVAFLSFMDLFKTINCVSKLFGIF